MKSKDIFIKTATALTLITVFNSAVAAEENADAEKSSTTPAAGKVAKKGKDAEEKSQSKDDEANARELKNVSVNARRRKEKLQDVPLPISVARGYDLESKKAYQIQDYQQIFPNLTTQFIHARQSSMAVRGIGNNIANEGLEQSTGVYLDNVFLGRPGMAVFDLLDIEQVDLLRGPQGTLFGKNTTAGVLNISTRKPVFDDEGSLEFSYGNRNYDSGKFVLNKAINNDWAVRVSGYQTHDDGWIKNLYDGKNLGEINRMGIRGQALYKPSDDFDLRLIYEHNEEDSSTGTLVPYSFAPITAKGNLTYPQFVRANGGLITSNPNLNQVNFNSNQSAQIQQNGASAEANWGFKNGFKLTSVSAWRDWNFNPQNDLDQSTLDGGNGGFTVGDNQFSQEIRLASPTGKLYDYVVGGYYMRQDAKNHLEYHTGANGGITANLPNNAYLDGYGSATTNSYAFFGQGTLHATDKFDLTLGLRDTLEAKDGRVNQLGTHDPLTGQLKTLAQVGTPLFLPYDSGEQHLFSSILSGQATASYKFTDKFMGYTSYSRGAKSGGWNVNAVASPASLVGTKAITLLPELADNVELGFKSSWLDNKVYANVNYFMTKVQNYQATTNAVLDGRYVGILTNVGDVTSQGVEFDFRAVPIPRLELGLNGAFTDARFDSGTAPTPFETYGYSPAGNGYGKGTINLAGNKLNVAPSWILNPSIQYSWKFADKIDQYFNTNYGWRSESFGDINNSSLSKIPSYGVLNVSTGWRIPQGKHSWDFSIWAKNIADEHYYLGLFSGTQNNYAASIGTPRTVGATIKFTY